MWNSMVMGDSSVDVQKVPAVPMHYQCETNPAELIGNPQPPVGNGYWPCSSGLGGTVSCPNNMVVVAWTVWNNYGNMNCYQTCVPLNYPKPNFGGSKGCTWIPIPLQPK